VGVIQPSFQETKMQTNSKTEKATRIPSAVAIRFDRSTCVGVFRPGFSMKKSAAARLAKMRKKANMTRYSMHWIMA
jgi:hypothetical protein